MKVLSIISALIALMLFVAGCTAIVRPALVRLRRRRQAMALTGFAFVILGFAIDLDPSSGPDAGPVGLPILVAWIICMIAGWIVLRMATAVQARRAAPDPVEPGVPPAPAPAALIDPFWSDRPAFDQVPQPSDPAPVRARPIRATTSASLPGRPVPAQARRRTIWAPGESGTTASFTYTDRQGVVTDRVIANWRSEGSYIRGFCLDQADHRTFRKDQIEDWRA